SSIDLNHAFLANRNDKGGEAAYLNCPLNKEEYELFIDTLLSAEKVSPKNFEKEVFFQGCQPIEAIAATGRESLRFGPMRPVGLTDPKTGRWAHAVVQLRPENDSRTAYNLVGFQTKLKYGEQKRVFSLIPALKNAEFLRLGSIHRNTYLCAPRVLRSDLSLKGHPKVYFAGQITGVEGYLESAACGLMAALFIFQRLLEKPHDAPPASTALGSLLRHVTASDPKHYQPNNMHFGLFDLNFFDGLTTMNKSQVKEELVRQASQNFKTWWKKQEIVKSISNDTVHLSQPSPF
ncbi:MAG TPA: methylenetetrahydrofolate--tRNA-(uracil(54)-C(5))-methyltransferase (FADH(2)-oxidizing) TrmFO, partial [Rhabdochlamydiaceae bacterium]|nr:methylenetetrahydrofolate--tRNA-(uracil(54)-C(5))-methyltransferase (FADH(2)-oxidizing) TrmFO [Rhabdochlamydiaceae bacterium]